MAYSRWTTSVWYTYYCVTYSDKRDDQIFDICSIKSFTYGELKKDINGCLTEIKKLCPEATDKEIDELEGYMKRFVDDIKTDLSLDEYEKVAACPEFDLPLLVSELKTIRGIRALEHRLRGENLDTLEPCD
jgi:hypothetical protein